LEYLRLHNKPKAEVHPGHKVTGPEEGRGEEEREGGGGEEGGGGRGGDREGEEGGRGEGGGGEEEEEDDIDCGLEDQEVVV
jgi:hypothetical protein